MPFRPNLGQKMTDLAVTIRLNSGNSVCIPILEDLIDIQVFAYPTTRKEYPSRCQLWMMSSLFSNTISMKVLNQCPTPTCQGTFLHQQGYRRCFLHGKLRQSCSSLRALGGIRRHKGYAVYCISLLAIDETCRVGEPDCFGGVYETIMVRTLRIRPWSTCCKISPESTQIEINIPYISWVLPSPRSRGTVT